ncbi:MAG: hypothetical protein HYR81_03675, partial [Nitrospirae bacterium]|nr:hypothetical protein [Nitrospirota bacterium]
MIKIFLFTNTLLSLVLGLFVFLKDHKNRVNRLYLFSTIIFALWSFSFGMMLKSSREIDALFWGKALFLPAIYISVVHCQATLAFVGREKLNKTFLKTAYIFASLLVPFDIFGNLFLKGVRPILDFNYYTEAGYLMFPFSLFFFSMVIFTLYQLKIAFQASSNTSKPMILYVALSWLITYTGGSTTFIPTFGIKFYPYGVFIVPLYFFITGYAIGISSLILFPIAGIFYIGHLWISRLTPVQLSLYVWAVTVLLIPYVKFIQPRIDHLFQRRKYDMQKILQGMVKELAALKNLDRLIEKIAATIKEALYVSKITLILWSDKNQNYKVVGTDEILSLN